MNEPSALRVEPQVALSPIELRAALEAHAGARHAIANDDLYDLVTYGDGAAGARLGIGNWNQGYDVPRVVLTFLAQKAFGIHRLPDHQDRFSVFPPVAPHREQALAFLQDRARLEAAIVALQALHAHSVHVLQSIGVTHVRLRRGLRDEYRGPGVPWAGQRLNGYATRVATMAQLAQALRLGSFCVAMDVLSSWSTGGYSHFAVVIERDIPIADIVWCSALVATRHGLHPRLAAVEGDEWVMLNRAPDGRVPMAARCVVRDDLAPFDPHQWVPERMREVLSGCEDVYGRATSMFRDVNPLPCRRVSLAGRVRRALAVFRSRYA